jgi:bifunctional NMN adenylyltransferase/nudix hydrolase
MSNEKHSIGVIIGRFQVHTLTAGHRYLIDHVMSKHETVIVLVGCSPVRNKRNPLDYQQREAMIRSFRSRILTLPLLDRPSDTEWSNQIDSTLHALLPNKRVVLYGGRDGFFPNYKGRNKTVEVKEQTSKSGTDMRADLKYAPVESTDFRAGIVYATECDYPRALPVVDVAILRQSTVGYDVLMARKAVEENSSGVRFIGGFVDPTDDSLEETVAREVSEETGLEVSSPTYIGSTLIRDWRYRNSSEGVISSFFAVDYLWGIAKANDDIAQVEWVPADHVQARILPVHKPLADLLAVHLKLHAE